MVEFYTSHYKHGVHTMKYIHVKAAAGYLASIYHPLNLYQDQVSIERYYAV